MAKKNKEGELIFPKQTTRTDCFVKCKCKPLVLKKRIFGIQLSFFCNHCLTVHYYDTLNKADYEIQTKAAQPLVLT